MSGKTKKQAKFQKDDRVMSTPLAITEGIFKHPMFGVVTGTPPRGKSNVRVRVGDWKYGQIFHESFWMVYGRESNGLILGLEIPASMVPDSGAEGDGK